MVLGLALNVAVERMCENVRKKSKQLWKVVLSCLVDVYRED